MLVLRDLTAGYGATTVLRKVNLIVPPGSVVALLGPNGAGKTTLLRAASGLLTPKSGSVLIDGHDVTGADPDRLMRRGVCHIPEGRGVFRSLTVRENLVTFSRPGAEEKAISSAVEAFPRLGERINQVAGTMSGGEQQMLALARAYVQKPRFVLLDEVSMGLAPKIVDEVFSFLALLANRGAALLLVEQYVARALDVADYVYLLNKGEVAFAGEPDELDADALAEQYVGSAAH
ncbi:ABC transporter ATP-binding protein [Sporichthya polymorpha]|uniref:ABC transporter ATP-binding protein n=1 Tax=Sporichthya polymorpha TaxID=35751 RepID=UPI0003603D73|nr:ABC transporter ATP-binding protein [Sporichthya polymorpha]